MSVRRIKPYKSKSSGFIQKVVDIGRKIPKMTSIEDLKAHAGEFSKEEYLSLYQSFLEAEIWNSSSWEERQILAPLIDFFYDNNNCPVLIYPKFYPFATEQDALEMEEDECLGELCCALSLHGVEDEEIGNFIQKIIDFCEDFDLSEEDILSNLSNLGWNSTFCARVIDFGLSNEMIKWFEEKNNV